MSEKKHAPATLRNRASIARVLKEELPKSGTVLEIASGSGEHAVYFAEKFSDLQWQPTDPDPDAIASINAYRDDYAGDNVRDPIMLDARRPDGWSIDRADAIVCINMVHISPWEATVGLFGGAADTLEGEDAPIILYGPYFEQGVETAPSNQDFDESLRQRDRHWGLRYVAEIDELAMRHGFARTARYEMPANNLTLVYRPA